MMKQLAYWIGFAFMRHRGWQIEILSTAQTVYLFKDEDIRSFHLQSGSSRKYVYDQAIKIINAWDK
jgi:hypothetical protein